MKKTKCLCGEFHEDDCPNKTCQECGAITGECDVDCPEEIRRQERSEIEIEDEE